MPPSPSPTKDAAVKEATAFAVAARSWLEADPHHTVGQLLTGDHIVDDGLDLSAAARDLRDRRARTIARLPKAAADILDALPGWTWRDPWAEFLAELDRWIDAHGSAQVPQHAVVQTADGETYPLGITVMNRRAEHARGKLSPERARELAARPGWTWAAQASRRKARLTALRRHAKKHGSVAGTSLKTADPSLYRWLLAQRVRTNLTPDELAELEAIPGALPDRRSAAAQFVDEAQAWIDAEPGRDVTHIPDRTQDGSDNPLAKRARYLRGRQRAGRLAATDLFLLEHLPGWQSFLGEQQGTER